MRQNHSVDFEPPQNEPMQNTKNALNLIVTKSAGRKVLTDEKKFPRARRLGNSFKIGTAVSRCLQKFKK